MLAELEVVATPVLSYVSAHHGVPIVPRVVVVLEDIPADLLEVEVIVTVEDQTGLALTEPWSRRLDGLVDRTREVLEPQIRPEIRALGELEEERTAEVVVTVVAQGRAVARTVAPLRVLAANQWSLDPDAPIVSLELLAAFVQPNHPVIGTLLPQVGQHLDRRTKSASLSTTDVSMERLDAIVEAVCLTVKNLGVAYANPPASWGFGQKVRGIGEVVEQRVGTCLDTVVAIASILEHLGVSPILWIAQGHAFLGWWRREGLGLPDPVTMQVLTAVNAVDLKVMGVAETTMLTRERNSPRDVFRQVIRLPLDRYFRGATEELVGVVDVALARTWGVRPLPARRTRPDGVIEIVEYHPPRPDQAGAPPRSTAGSDRVLVADVPAAVGPARTPPPRIRQWQNSLLDLTLRNPLLNLQRRVTGIPLLVPHGHLGTLATMLQEGRKVTLRALDDTAFIPVLAQVSHARKLTSDLQVSLLNNGGNMFVQAEGPQYTAIINRLRFRARTGLQETGANPLSVTFGRLDWVLGERELSAPLFVAPAELNTLFMPARLSLDTAGEVTLNLSLVEKLKQEFGLDLGALPATAPSPSGDGVDIAAAVDQIREAIAASGLPFRVDDEARVAILGFTGYLLWRDLQDHWEQFLESPLVRRLALPPNDNHRGGVDLAGDPDGDAQRARLAEDLAQDLTEASEEELNAITARAPIAVDGSQAEVIAAVNAGRSLVLEGPPGTGKSQTITNIIADQVAQGRTVLFVAEKGAALDVVRRRLEEVGLLSFALDLHNDAARPAEVRAQLRRALNHRPVADEQAYAAALQDNLTTATALADYAHHLHEPNTAGLSLYAARTLQLVRGDGPQLSVSGTMPGLMETVSAAVPALSRLRIEECRAWGFAGSVDPGEALWGLLAEADEQVRRAATVVAAVSPEVAQALALTRGATQLGVVAWLLRVDRLPMTVLGEVRTSRWGRAVSELQQATHALGQDTADLVGVLKPTAYLIDVNAVRQQLREASTAFFLWRNRRLVEAAAPLLAHLQPGAQVGPGQLVALAERVAAVSLRAGELAGRWRSVPGCGGLPAVNLVDPADVAALDAHLAMVREDAARVAGLPAPVSDALAAAWAHGAGLTPLEADQIGAAIGTIEAVAAATGGRGVDLSRWADSDLLTAWTRTVATRTAEHPSAAGLHRWQEAHRALASLEDVEEDARWQLLSGAVPALDASAALERGLAQATIAERLTVGGLRGFDGEAQDRVVDRFVTSATQLRASSGSVLPAEVIARRPFQTGRVFGSVAALEREINRSRGGLSVRRLMERFGSVICELTPCLLVSPDSLARFIPPGSITVDLVVFDEASQITVPDAIGALGRARAAVIAGDSKQMPPTAFGQSVIGDELDPDPAADFVQVQDEESILSEGVMAGLPRLWLTWHYRSADEALIAFSNRRYYDQRLLTFPAVTRGTGDTGVTFHRVQGHFHRSGSKGAAEDVEMDAGLGDEVWTGPTADGVAVPTGVSLTRTNPVEAAAVTAEVLRRWRAGERSIGVVTFNIQQRGLIEQMLVEAGDGALADSVTGRRDGIFVKNLENVQGDERDIIIFSTGFSVRADGVLPMNFGPLNRLGGERRLNVAVTRARRRVMVFSSFDPKDLRVEQSASVGLRDLRAYLEFAQLGGGAAKGFVPAGVLDRHREDIAAGLRGRGLSVTTGLGMSDFQVDLAVGPGTTADTEAGGGNAGDGNAGQASPVLAVLLDSPAWAKRRTTADRDSIGPLVLRRSMGWRGVSRVWLPAWLLNPDAVLDRLTEDVEAAMAAVEHIGEQVVAGSSTQVDLGDLASDADDADWAVVEGAGTGEVGADGGPESGFVGVEPAQEVGVAATTQALVGVAEAFEPHVPTLRGTTTVLNRLSLGHPTSEVVAVIDEVVRAEGPVSPSRLARLVAADFGLSRVSASRASDILAAVPPSLARDGEEGFVWPAGRDPVLWEGYRTFPGPSKDRPLDDVALREIANAMIDIARSAMGIEIEELSRETVRTFGGTRVTPAVRDRLQLAFDLAVKQRRLVALGSVARVP